MKNRLKIFFFLSFISNISLSNTHASSTLNWRNELTENEIKDLEKGEIIQKLVAQKDSSWPLITQFVKVKASPLEAAAIFSALDYQMEYVPNLLKSYPRQHLSPTEVLVEYELHVPFPLSNAHYIHGNKLKKIDEDYELSWYMTKSTSTEFVQGSAYFTSFNSAFKNQETLFKYTSFIKPKSLFASMVKSLMLKDIKKTVGSIKDHIEKLKKENSPKILEYSNKINRALQGENVYAESIEKNKNKKPYFQQ